jgi:hypothetical protein
MLEGSQVHELWTAAHLRQLPRGTGSQVIDTAAALIVYIGFALVYVGLFAGLTMAYRNRPAPALVGWLVAALMWQAIGLAAWLLAAALLLVAALVGAG